MSTIPLFKVRNSPKAKEEVAKVLDSGYLGQGPKVEQFEKELEKKFNRKVLTTNSCTSAIDLALHLCGVGPGDEVISTPMTCFATNSVIINRGAKIKWADVDIHTGLIDPISVREILINNPKGYRAIMAVDWAGNPCDYARLKSFGFPVIQDAAHCWNNKPEGDYVCYSFQAIKFLTCGDGGALITPDDKYEEAELLRWYGLSRRNSQSFRCTQNIFRSGFKYHMNDIAASIGLSNMKEADDSVEKQKQNALYYCMELEDIRTITTPYWSDDCCYWLYSILINKGTKEEFIQHMKDRGIECSPVHFRNDMYDCTAQFKEGPLPGLDHFSSKQVSIPVGWWLSQEDKERIVDAIRKY